VVVADDERPARSFLVSLPRSFDDVAVVGEAASGKDAVAIIEKERPDLALLDWQMPELDGIGIVRMSCGTWGTAFRPCRTKTSRMFCRSGGRMDCSLAGGAR
jgi:DNA-binding NarL/FixJ family response regulator